MLPAGATALPSSLALLLAAALSPLDAYQQGNRLYAQRNYAQAALAYEQALAAGPSAVVHYNLANACFKSGRIGRAILHYRRARYLAPRDPDIRANLDFARRYRVDKLAATASPVAKALDDALHWLSRREAALWTAVLTAFAAGFLAVWIVTRRTPLLAPALLCGALALAGLATQRAWIAEIGSRPAVVVAPEARAWSGPSEEFKEILLLHDGSEVRIREARGQYLLIQLPGGSGGWIRKDAVERVY